MWFFVPSDLDNSIIKKPSVVSGLKAVAASHFAFVRHHTTIEVLLRHITSDTYGEDCQDNLFTSEESQL